MRSSRSDRYYSSGILSPKAQGRYPWLPWAWLCLLFVSDINISTQDPVAALSGSASLGNMIELAVYGAVGGAALVVLGRRQPGATESRMLTLLLGFGTLAVMSSLWAGGSGIFSFARGSQVLGVGLLAWVTADIWRGGSRNLEADWALVWIRFVWAVAGLVLLGLVVGWGGSRFAWPGLHPVAVGGYLALAAVISLVIAPGSMDLAPRFTKRASPALLGVFLFFMLLNATRSALAAVSIGLAAVWLGLPARKPVLRWLSVLSAAVIAALALSSFWDPISSYLLRGQEAQEVAQLSGRVPLLRSAWELGLEHPILGYGYGMSKVLFLDLFDWAPGSAHNMWAALFVDLGLLGVVVALWLSAEAIRVALRSRRGMLGTVAVTALALILVALTAAIADTGFAFPSLWLTATAFAVTALSVTDEPNLVAMDRFLGASG